MDEGGKLYGSAFLIASIAIAYYAYRRSHKDVNITAGDVNLKLAGLLFTQSPSRKGNRIVEMEKGFSNMLKTSSNQL